MMVVDGSITTKHRHPACVAQALRPDNLSSMTTAAIEGGVKTTITSTQIRSVIASADDYLMNLAIAEDICQCGSR